MNQQIEDILRMVRETPVLVFDVETSGLDWKRNFPIGYVIGSTPTDVTYTPIRHGGGGNLPDPNVVAPSSPTEEYVQHWFEVALAEAFAYRTEHKVGITVGHHIKFDCHFAANGGIMLGRALSCTQNNEALLNEYSRSFSLDACAKAHGVSAKKGQDLYDHIANLFGCVADKKSMAHFWELSGNDTLATEYAIGDGVSTLELYHAQKVDMTEQKLEMVGAMEDQLIWTLFRMERRGIRLDVPYLHELQAKVKARVEEAIGALPPGFNVRSPIDMKNYCTEAGHTDWPLTVPHGNPSFTEKWLKTFPEGQRIVVIRKWSNLDNTFITPLIEEFEHNGRVHTNLNQLKADEHGTVSGRLSCSGPNLQQIPKRDKEIAKMFRKAFLPDPGHKFYEGDYSQCEPRLFGHYSEEPAIVDGYNQTPHKDMHAVVAELLQVERDPTAKRMNMGILTGMFPKSFAGHMGWDIPTATEKWNQWFDAFPGIKDFQNKAKDVLRSRGYIRTLLGRRGRLESPRFAYRAVSKIIQGGNADILKWKMLTLDLMCEARGDIVHLLMTVHDSFVWQAPDTPEGEAFSAEMVKAMEDVQGPPFNLSIPFIVDVGSGANWKEASFGEG